MRSSKTRARLRNNEVVRMCSLGNPNQPYVRHAAHFGFDCIWLDAEHRAFNDRELQAMLAHFHLFDIDCMLRASTTEKTKLYRYLEDGAAGLMIPHVSTPEKAAMLVDAVKFPPIGNRGLDGAGLDNDYYVNGLGDYPERANEETFLVVQIETLEAVENVDAIAAVKGVDAMFVGPGDLGLRLKHAKGAPSLDDCFERVAKAAKKHGIAWGCPVATMEDMQKRYDQGGRLLAHGGEFWAVMRMLEQCAADFKALKT